jgi:C-terminal processing protease CtpA/Prc
VNFRDLFFVFEGPPGSTVEVTWQPPGAAPKTATLVRTPEEAGDALVWRSARVIRKDGKSYGYAHLWGMSAETALAIVDMLSDRRGAEGSRPAPVLESRVLLDVRGNSGLRPQHPATFLRGQWAR